MGDELTTEYRVVVYAHDQRATTSAGWWSLREVMAEARRVVRQYPKRGNPSARVEQRQVTAWTKLTK